VVVNEPTEELYASAANLSNVAVLTPSNLSVYDLLDATSLVLTKASVKKLEELING
jgi:ribosomal protein L4